MTDPSEANRLLLERDEKVLDALKKKIERETEVFKIINDLNAHLKQPKKDKRDLIIDDFEKFEGWEYEWPTFRKKSLSISHVTRGYSKVHYVWMLSIEGFVIDLTTEQLDRLTDLATKHRERIEEIKIQEAIQSREKIQKELLDSVQL